MNAPDGLPTPQRTWAFLTIVLGLTMAVMDGAVANVALPIIAKNLHAPASTSIWIVNAYQLAVVTTLLPLSALGEIVGYRRIYLGGLLLFTLASLGCAASGSLVALTLARVVQGLGAAGIMSVNTALVRYVFPQPMLGRGIGYNALVVATAASVAPTFASAVLSVASWPWLFALNVPLGIAALATGRGSLPESPHAERAFDWKSAILSALTFGLVITTIDSVGHALAPPIIAVQAVAGLVVGVLLVRRQLSLTTPLLPLDLLRRPIFTLSLATSVTSFAAQMLAFVSLPFDLQGRMGFDAVATGLLMTPWPVATAITAPIAGRLADRYPAGLLGGIGLAVFAGGLFALGHLPTHPASADIEWRMALCGMGFGLFQSPNNRAIIGAAPRERSGSASGMLGTARLFGQTLGASLVALILARYTQAGVNVALNLASAIAAVAAVVSCLRLRSPSPAAEASAAH